jgi:2-methylcitrate dehydratase PrpD
VNAQIASLNKARPEAVEHAAAAQSGPVIAEQLARFACELSPEAIPQPVVRRAKHLMLDAIGIAYASTTFEFAHRALTAISELAGAGDHPVIGFDTRLPLRDAALMNGILIHGLDFDDTHMGGVIHVTSSILPTVLGVGARCRASGQAALAAYVMGIEVAARLGSVAKGAFHQVGFHPTGLIGAFACALVAGRLMGLNARQLVMAQGIALSAGAGSLEFLEDGAWTKRFHPGWAAVAGITAAALARQGFVGPTRVYEGRFGLYNSYLQGHFDPVNLALATAGLGTTWELLQVAVKPFPACHFAHACADAAIALVREGKMNAEEIDRVRVLVPAEVVKTVCEPITNKRRPANSYDAQFSIPYIVSAALLRGRFGLAELETEALGDHQILDLANRVDYEIDPNSGFPRYYSGEVIVTTKDGRTLRHREHMNRGCGDRPLGEADVRKKFRDNAERAIAGDRAERLIERVLSISDVEDMRDLADGLAHG